MDIVPLELQSLKLWEERLKKYLPEAQVQNIFNHRTRVTFSRNEIIFEQNSPADVAFCVLSGIVKLYCPLGRNKRVFLSLAGPGDLLGYEDFMGSSGRRLQRFEAQAFSKVSLALVTREFLRQVASQLDSQTLIKVSEDLNTAWSLIAQSTAVFFGGSFRHRLESVFLDLARRFGVADKRGRLVLSELSHLDLAEMIQSSRPLASRLVAELLSEGLIEQEGRRYIVTHRLLENDSSASSSQRTQKLGTGSSTSVYQVG